MRFQTFLRISRLFQVLSSVLCNLLSFVPASATEGRPELRWEVRLPHDGDIQAIAFSADGTSFLSAGAEGVVRTFDTKTQMERPDPLCTGSLKNVEPSKENGVAIICQAGLYATAVALQNDNRVAFGRSAGDSTMRDIQVWDLKTRKVIAILGGQNDDINSLAFDAQGRFLVSGGDAGQVYFWDVNHRKRFKVLSKGGTSITKVALSPSGEFCAASTSTGTIKIWNTHSGKLLQSKKAHPAIVDLAFSKDGEWIYSVGEDNIKTWPTKNGHLVRKINIDHDNGWPIGSGPDDSGILIDGDIRLYQFQKENVSLLLRQGYRTLLRSSPDHKFFLKATGFVLSLWF